MKRKGVSIVVSAPSGAGKSTLCKMLLLEFPNIAYSISCTTRPPREGEVNGRDYIFLSRPEFEEKIRAGDLAEWAEVHGNFYGTPLAPVRESMDEGRDILFDIDVQGGEKIKKAFPATGLVFILPPHMEDLVSRLRSRGKDDEAIIKKRMLNAEKEIREAIWYDALIINDNLDEAYAMLKSFYLARTLAPACHEDFLNAILKEKAWPRS